MGIKRVLKGGSKPSHKHKYNLRSKSKCDQFDLKNFDLRFPHLTSKILSELNPKSLVTFSKVDRFMCENVENQRIYWIRRIQSKSNKFDEFKKEWACVLKKISMKTLMLLETALGLFESENADQYSPLHIAAKFDFELFMEIESKFKNKNPSNSNGDTPLHCAVGNGHLETCQWIIARNIGNDLKQNNLYYIPIEIHSVFLDRIIQSSSSAREQVNPVPSGSMLTLVAFPSSTRIEKRLHLTLPRTFDRSSSRSRALVKAPQVSANMRTFPLAF